MIDGICQRYHHRPSEIIGIKDEYTALDFDVAIAVRASEMEEDKTNKPKVSSEETRAGFAKMRAFQNKTERIRG